MSAVVVLLPLVPVMAINGASGRDERALAAEQFDVADDLDAGRAGPGDAPVRLGMGQRHAGRQDQRRKAGPVGLAQVEQDRSPSAAALSRAACESSQTVTRAPPAASALAVERPEPPRPNRATVVPQMR